MIALGSALLGAVTISAGSPFLLGVVVLGALGVVRARRRTAEIRTRRRRHVVCLALVEAVAGELRAGRLPRAAMATAVASTRTMTSAQRVPGTPRDDGADVDAVLGPLAASTELHGDLPAALTQVSRLPGASALSWLSACWRVSEQRGSGLADAVDRIAVSIRADHEHDLEIRAELAPVRATARLLAVLPLLGVALGHAIGADVTGVLLGTVVGAVLLSVAVALVLLGTLWVDGLAASAGRERRRQ